MYNKEKNPFWSMKMSRLFSDTIKKLRNGRGLSQQALASQLFVTRSTVARWENGTRLPDAVMISRLAEALGVDAAILLSAAAERDILPNVILVDDRKLILMSGLPVLEKVIPNATVTGFTDADEAIEFAKANRVALAFLDIELRNTSGLDLCRSLLEINPHTNVVYLTAYPDYSLDAWNTGACGFMLKPITAEGIREQLEKLRYPFWTGGDNA